MAPTRDALPRAEPVDLEIHVTTPWGGGVQSVEYMLDSPSGRVDFHKEKIAGPTLKNPDAFQQRLFDQISGLQQRYDIDGNRLSDEEISGELLTIGNGLYRELFPRGLRRIYRDDLRDRIETLVITSDEPWIPWEILQPTDDDGEFLCMRYRMTRWLAGASALAPGKRVQRMLGMQAGRDLRASASELDYLRSLVADVPGLESEILAGASAHSVTEEIEGRGFDLFHFAGHGEVDPTRPGESKILFEDTAVRARHLTPHAQRLLREARPLVFFNSCHVGRSGSSLTGLGGWASTWVDSCACSAFVAPLWAVDDFAAELFASTFYYQLAHGATLGDAVREGRKVLREQGADSLTWLAYTVYGHPNARFSFGDSDPTTSPPPLPRIAPPVLRPPPAISTRATARTVSAPRSRPGLRTSLPRLRPTTYGGLVVLVLCVVLAGLSLPDLLPPEGPSTVPGGGDASGGSVGGPNGSEGGATGSDGGAGSEEESRDPTPEGGEGATDPETTAARADALPEAQDPPPPPPPRPPEIPYQAIQTGRVAVLAFRGGAPDPEVTGAIRSSMLKAQAGLRPFVIEARFAGQARALSAPFTRDGRTPWGAEYLLLPDVDRKSLSQRAAHLTGVALTLTGELIDLRSGSSAGVLYETHTGAGATTTTALHQATGRCLDNLFAARS